MIDAHECGCVRARACVNACLRLSPESPGLSAGQDGGAVHGADLVLSL